MIIPFWIIGSLYPTCVTDRFINLSVKHTLSLHFDRYNYLLVSDQCKYTFEGLWYFLRGYRPSKTDHLILSFLVEISYSIQYIKVFHGCFHSLVFYTIYHKRQYQNTVKLHRVFASSGRQTASARLIQFHWEASGDSRAALPHSCRTTFNGQGISLLSDPYS